MLKIDHIQDIPKNYTGKAHTDNALFYVVKGLIHREDGPAVGFDNDGVGSQFWYFQNRQIEEDGIAFCHDVALIVEVDVDYSVADYTGSSLFPDGTRCWYQKGKLHRKDGPSVVHAKGGRDWYFTGCFIPEDGFAFCHAAKMVWLDKMILTDKVESAEIDTYKSREPSVYFRVDSRNSGFTYVPVPFDEMTDFYWDAASKLCNGSAFCHEVKLLL